MSGLFETRRIQEQRRSRRRWLIISMIILIGGATGGGYLYGRKSELALRAKSNQQIETLQKANQDLVDGLASLQIKSDTTLKELADLQARYDADVPTGPARELSSIAIRRLSHGIPFARLKFVLEHTKANSNCDEVEVKRFRPRTRLGPAEGIDTRVSFADGQILISADGDTDRDEEHNPVAWYDPAQDVTIKLKLLGGIEVPLRGQLPLQHQEVIGNTEHRFSFTAGPRSFMLVTHQSCAYP